jgi:hypothetical protein
MTLSLTVISVAETPDNLVVPVSLASQPPLVRKKLGELVKSSLKLSGMVKSMSSPQLFRNKSVRFASRLTNIRMFDGAASPLAVSNNNSPSTSPPLDPEDRELRFRVPRDYFEWNYQDSWNDKAEYDQDSESSDSDCDVTERNPWYSSSNQSFELESTDILRPHQYFYQQQEFVTKPVHLHSIQLSTMDKTTYLTGLVNVQNLAFEKSLMFKLTLNDWKTNVTIMSSTSHTIAYNKSLNNGAIDQFKFKISLQDLILRSPDVELKKNPQINIELCIRYCVGNQEFWDNNSNNNYKLSIKSFTSTSSYQNSNTIKSYSYTSNKTPTPTSLASLEKEKEKFDDLLVSKLEDYKQSHIYGETSQWTTAPKKKSEFFNRYNNINDELKATTDGRPVLAKAYSTSNVLTTKPRYSNSYRSKHIASVAGIQPKPQVQPQVQPSQTPSKASAIDLTNTQFNSSGYSALLANFCFSGGSETKATPSNAKVPCNITSSTSTSNNNLLLNHCSTPSTASMLHSFNDSIHI